MFIPPCFYFILSLLLNHGRMTDIPIPFVGQEVDTDDGLVGIVMSLAIIIAGFAVFAMASSIGSNLGSRVNEAIATVLGVNPATGTSGDSSPDIL